MARKKKSGDTLAFNNAAKTLLANIRFASVDTPIKSITVTSSIPNEGKSTIALNLAQAIATSGKSVLLVECDMRHRTLVAALEEKYQYVIFDTPPVGTFVDAAEVAAITDGTIYVVRQDFAKRNEILAAFDQLNKAEVNVIGTVMNCCETSSHDYYYSYYGGDKGQNNAAVGVDPAVGGAAASGTPAKAKRFKK